MKDLIMHKIFGMVLVLGIIMTGALSAHGQEITTDNERNNLFSTLRERQIESRRELQERIAPTQEEVRQAVSENIGSALYDFVIAQERLATATQTIIERRNRLFTAGYATADIDALLRESIDMILENQALLRNTHRDIQSGEITSREQLSTILIDLRGDILATQNLLVETWALLQDAR